MWNKVLILVNDGWWNPRIAIRGLWGVLGLRFGAVLFGVTSVFWMCGVCDARGDGSVSVGRDADLRVVGGREIAWALRKIAGGENADQLWRLVSLGAGGERRSGRWSFPFGSGEVAGDILVTAVCGTRLHVWYADGTHRFVEPRRSGAGSALPSSAVPLAAAGSEDGGRLYVLVPALVAMELNDKMADGLSRFVENGAEADGVDEGGGEFAVEEASAGGSGYSILRLDGGNWEFDRPAPNWLTSRGEVWLLSFGDSLGLVCRPAVEAGVYVYSHSSEPGGEWSRPQRLDDLGGASVLAVSAVDGVPLLVVRRDGDSAVWTMVGAGDGWSPGPVLRLGGSWSVDWGETSLGVLGNRVVGVWESRADGGVYSAEWDIESGAAVSEAALVRPLMSGRAGMAWDWRRLGLAYVVLALVLAAVFFRRRESVVVGVSLPPQYQLVGHLRRLTAFIIDLALFFPFSVLAYKPLLEEFNYDANLLRQAATFDASVMSGLTWRWVAVSIGFIVYAAVFEACWAATPGKRLMGVRVVDEHGDRCGIGRIITRNLLRAVEFFPFLDLIPTLILILLTRNRQRLGDLIGGTVVVQVRRIEQANERSTSF